MISEYRKKQYLEIMIDIKKDCESDLIDKERAHKIADDILCNILLDLGLEEIVNAFYDVPKWYA